LYCAQCREEGGEGKKNPPPRPCSTQRLPWIDADAFVKPTTNTPRAFFSFSRSPSISPPALLFWFPREGEREKKKQNLEKEGDEKRNNKTTREMR